MAYTFDGVNKLIILSSGTTTVDAKDMYSRWKEWSLTDDNAKYLQALSVLGGDPLPGGRYLGTTYFVENEWKIRPYEGNHTLVLSGNLYSRDGSDPFVNTLGNFNVRIMLTVSNLVDTVTTGGGVGTVDEVKAAVWSDTNFASYGPTTAGSKLNAAGAAGDPWGTDLSSYPSGTAGHLVYNAPDAVAIADQVRTELTPELTAIMALQNGLTNEQAIMLTEIYRMHGLDPTKPLVVTKTARTAGVDIQQQIAGNDTQTIVTRV